MKMKKIVAVLLVLALSLGLFAACTPTNQGPESTTASGGTDKEDVVNLKWVTVGGGMPSNYDKWQAELNKYLEDKIGVHLDIEVIGWGDWDKRRAVMVSTNEPYDIMFTNIGTYAADVKMGAFADITELIDKVPDLKNLMPEDYWNACKLDGKIYGVPTYKDTSMTFYFVYDKPLVESTGLDYQNAHTLEAIVPILEAMKEKESTTKDDKGNVLPGHVKGEPPFIVINTGIESIAAIEYDSFGTGLPAIGVSYTAEGKPQVVSVFEQPEIRSQIETLRTMAKKGLINSDAPVLTEAPKYIPCGIAQGWSGAAVSTWGPGMGTEAVAIQYTDKTVLSRDSVQGSVNCISKSCKHPEKALELLQLVNTDVKVRDMLFYGLEGDNFEYDANHKVHKLNEDWNMAGYTQGTFFIVTPTDKEADHPWDEVKQLNEKAIVSPLIQFSFDSAAVANEISACISIYKEWRGTAISGVGTEKDLDSMINAMKEQGLEKIIAEAQKQIDAWYTAK